MPNQSGRMYGLTALCPIRNGGHDNRSYASITRQRLEQLDIDQSSPMARVPNTYLARLFLLDDVYYEGKPAQLDHLKSSYLVFVADFHGDLEPYLQAAWEASSEAFRKIWEYGVAFDQVHDAAGFIDYIKKCQVYTTFLFNGSSDESLAEQLKSLYLKQEFSKFAFENQGLGAKELRQAFQQFVARTQPANLAGPTWRPGASSLKSAIINEKH
jgi:hypothetical protein